MSSSHLIISIIVVIFRIVNKNKESFTENINILSKKQSNHDLYVLRVHCDESRERGSFNRRRVKREECISL